MRRYVESFSGRIAIEKALARSHFGFVGRQHGVEGQATIASRRWSEGEAAVAAVNGRSKGMRWAWTWIWCSLLRGCSDGRCRWETAWMTLRSHTGSGASTAHYSSSATRKRGEKTATHRELAHGGPHGVAPTPQVRSGLWVAPRHCQLTSCPPSSSARPISRPFSSPFYAATGAKARVRAVTYRRRV